MTERPECGLVGVCRPPAASVLQATVWCDVCRDIGPMRDWPLPVAAWGTTAFATSICSKDDSTLLTAFYCGATQNDLQAQARAHRLGQTRTVMIYRCAARGHSGAPA